MEVSAMKTPAKSIAQRHGYRGLQRSDGPALLPEEPLWRRVPSRDEEGRCLADFRMIIPGLRDRSGSQQRNTLRIVNAVLQHYGAWVVFADFNFRTNLLWVSIKPRPGLTLEIPAAIKTLVPEALLLAAYWRR
ncbi:hypothetical protein A5904_01205 [Acidithiobacillus caldus]|jgi:hypothetical protein|uniref:Uncharacterized protein n=5 Tax=Acidithiobacillaceae TaxID=225058 RepID=F9ZPC8_ACICS|nr:conserved hypothetical protein [Acidithiobacillus caldus SM-1]AIA54245.1 hypothetical protein Acaty_c0355 [Acidithiobacillus caldus ATCC 51756]AUW31773.1 hypothetical protein A5904_01205 [Acidithiobacillus caldus]MCE5419555.1 hypothetical protein [Acidithiobacillus sp.]MBU2730896.1 hypothetical protein [Acidithiobacillus caldus]